MITVIENQSFLDVAIQEDGSVLTAFELALSNGFSITDDLVPGQKINEAFSVFRNNEVANYFKGKNQLIATAISTTDLEIINPPLGIGKMVIGSTFIVG